MPLAGCQLAAKSEHDRMTLDLCYLSAKQALPGPASIPLSPAGSGWRMMHKDTGPASGGRRGRLIEY